MDEQEEQSIVDTTESEASDGMLIDGLRTFLEKRQERKKERSALKEKRKKRTRAEKAKAKGHMNKGRATAYSGFSIGYFAKIVDVVCKSNHRMEVVRNGGFGYLLELEDCYVRRPFAQWVADNISTKEEAIVLGGKSIPLNPEAVSLVLGIPAGRTKIRVLDEESGKAEFLSLFGLTYLPSISFFGNKIMKEELPDDVYLRCFFIVALATFLCPTSNTKPSTKYLGALVDVSKYKDLDWCSFVHTWNISYVKKYQTDKLKEKRITTTLGGCIYQLAVRCLDFNNFGSITIPPAIPRICFWKGQTIKHFSDMLLGKDGLYGALQIKDEAETCYAQTDGAWASTTKNSNIRNVIQRILGNSFSEKIKEDIFLNFQERVKDQNLTTCLIAKQVLLDTLNIVSSSFNGSQQTEKLESSNHLYMPTEEDNGSGSTIRVDSNGIEINSDGRGRKKRLKTSTQQSETSTNKDNLLEVKIEGSKLEVAAEGGEAEMQSLPGNAHRNDLEKQAEMDQTMQNRNVATQQPEINMPNADTNIPKCNPGDCSAQKEAAENNTSLNYMLLSARLARALDMKDQDNNSKEEASTHVPPTFSSFQHNAVNSNKSEHCIKTETMYQANEAAAIECVGLDTRQQENNNQDDFRFNEVREQGKHAGLDIDINIPLSNSGIDDKQEHVEDFQHTMHPLDVARQKKLRKNINGIHVRT
uniref:Aminotransferase-like plant mobile domain-containing protein n=1 Tax=Triticum urartu TaxID=4572 RepID=A0A8R7RC39_TRIUA